MFEFLQQDYCRLDDSAWSIYHQIEKSPIFGLHAVQCVSLPKSGDFHLARPAGFEPTAYRLGEANSIRICVPSNALECLILLDF